MYNVLGMFPLVHGDISGELPEETSPHGANGWKEGVATFGYKGVYRRGERSEFRFGYDGDAGEEIGIGSQAGKCVGFKGHSQVSRQTIRFTVELKTPDTIEGRYESRAPEDRGTFVMRKSEKGGE